MIGSTWRKWDLHFHTPSSYDYKDNSITNEEIVSKLIDEKVEVVAITDHHIIDIDRIKKLKELGNNKLTVLPGIEFRSELGGSESIHFIGIFPENINIEDVWIKLQSVCKITKSDILQKGGDANIHCDFRDTSKAIHELGGLVSVHAGGKSNSLEGISNTLSHKTALKTELIQGFIDILELGKPEDAMAYEKIVFPEIKKNLPMIICSDSHNIHHYNLPIQFESNRFENDILKKLDCSDNEYIKQFYSKNKQENVYILAKKITIDDNNKICQILKKSEYIFSKLWIKSDPTFEGLRQVLFEPSYRISLSEDKPMAPIKNIKSIKIDIPSNLSIHRNGGKGERFCFSGVSKEILFSPYFTSIIGGRGTGKSTLLSLIHKGFNPANTNTLFQNNHFALEGKKISLEQYLHIDTSSNEIEYLEQNHIEEFATNPKEFTKAIFNRIKKRNDQVSLGEKNILEEISKVRYFINKIKEKQKIEDQLKEIGLTLQQYQKISEGIKNEHYSKLNNDVNEKNLELSKYKNGRNKIEQLTINIDIFLDNNLFIRTPISTEPFLYTDNYNNFIHDVKLSKTKYLDQKLFENLINEEEKLRNQLEISKTNLSDYLKVLGVSEENLEDIKNSSIHIEEQKNLETQKKQELELIEKEINKFEYNRLSSIHNNTIKLIEDDLKNIQNILDDVRKKNSKDIDAIGLEIDKNISSIKQSIFDDFLKENDLILNNYRGVSKTDISECLFSIDIEKIIKDEVSYDDLLNSIRLKNNKYNKFLEEVFSIESNFTIYKEIIKSNYYNLEKSLKFNVSYRGKSIELSSFGQRCTTVIVILLMFGNTPIIIDEPEAHLDSSLIANYLVNLIKETKKHRQVIFATHNANFVINADCELIYILEMPENVTTFLETTIENLTHRNQLLNLEGGKVAFNVREKKYNTI